MENALQEINHHNLLMRASQARERFGFDGSGIVIAVIDNGVDSSHPMLKDKIVLEADFTGEGLSAGVHATHCAAIAAGREVLFQGRKLSGVAPGASIANMKCLSAESGEGHFSDIKKGVHHVVDEFKRLQTNSPGRFSNLVISLSLGLGSNVFANPHFNRLMAWASRKGALCVVAAPSHLVTRWKRHYRPLIVWVCDEEGNLVTKSCWDSPSRNGLIFEVPYAVSDLLSLDADLGPDILAPGLNIMSAKPGGGFEAFSGVSMAVACASGLAAMIWERYPQLSSRRLLDCFVLDGKGEGASGSGQAKKKHFPQAVNAVRIMESAGKYVFGRKTQRQEKGHGVEEKLLSWLEEVGPMKFDLNMAGVFLVLFGLLAGSPLMVSFMSFPTYDRVDMQPLAVCLISFAAGIICLWCDYRRHGKR